MRGPAAVHAGAPRIVLADTTGARAGLRTGASGHCLMSFGSVRGWSRTDVCQQAGVVRFSACYRPRPQSVLGHSAAPRIDLRRYAARTGQGASQSLRVVRRQPRIARTGPFLIPVGRQPTSQRSPVGALLYPRSRSARYTSDRRRPAACCLLESDRVTARCVCNRWHRAMFTSSGLAFMREDGPRRTPGAISSSRLDDQALHKLAAALTGRFHLSAMPWRAPPRTRSARTSLGRPAPPQSATGAACLVGYRWLHCSVPVPETESSPRSGALPLPARRSA